MRFLDLFPNFELTFIIALYARNWHIAGRQWKTSTETVYDWRALSA